MSSNYYSMRGHRTASILSSHDMSNFLKRGRKTSRDQVEMYVHFLEKNPAVAMARSNPTNDTVISTLWEDLTFRLNSSEQGPLKSSQQWQETFANWRYQLRFKTRKLIQRKEDGLDLQELSDLEERALRVFTSSTVNEPITQQEPTPSSYSTPGNRIPRRKFTRKRPRSSQSPQERRVTRNSMSVDSTSSQIYEPQPDCDANSFYDYLEQEQKPLILNEPVATSLVVDKSAQTENEATENNLVVTSSDSKTDVQVNAINKLEKAVNSLNDTLKKLVEVQSNILTNMSKR